jgi:hypothetical protein
MAEEQGSSLLLGAAALAALPKVVVLQGQDMPSETANLIITKAAEGLANYKVEKDQAMHVKKALEAWNGGMWHVIVGSSFGASVAHEASFLLMIRFGKVFVLVMQSFDESVLSGKAKVAKVERAVVKEDEAPTDE